MPARLLQPRYLAGAAVVVVAGILLLRAPWAAGVSGNTMPSDSTLSMNCEPHQRALVRQAMVSGRAQVTVACESAPVARVVRTSVTASRATAPAPVRRAEPTRSWKKTALVIGGSTGAGAGIGAAVGGKKGALIGAAIGGGASALYEAIKR